MPFAFSFCFRKGDVGGDRGFDAALAFRTCAEAESELEGDSRKKKMNINSTTPITTVTGLLRNDRVGPMAALCCWCPQLMVCSPINRMCKFAFVADSSRAGSPQKNVVVKQSSPVQGGSRDCAVGKIEL